MFILKKVLTPFLLPPGTIILVLLLFGVFAIHRKNKLAVGICFFCAALIWSLSISPTADSIMRGLEDGLAFPEKIDGDVIVMLGGNAYDQAPDLSGHGVPGEGTMDRLVTVARLFRQLKVPVIISGGKVFPESKSSGVSTKRFLVDLGIPSGAILMENKSRDTYENALYSKALCEHHGYRKPLVVTSGYHMKRALLCFQKVGLQVVPIPSMMTTWSQKRYNWYHYLPSAGAFRIVALAVHERIGILYTKMI